MAQGCGGNPAPFAYLGRELGLPAGRCRKVPESAGAGKVQPGVRAREDRCMKRRSFQ